MLRTLREHLPVVSEQFSFVSRYYLYKRQSSFLDTGGAERLFLSLLQGDQSLIVPSALYLLRPYKSNSLKTPTVPKFLVGLDPSKTPEKLKAPSFLGASGLELYTFSAPTRTFYIWCVNFESLLHKTRNII